MLYSGDRPPDGGLWSWMAFVCEWTARRFAGHFVTVSSAIETVPAVSVPKRIGRIQSTTVLATVWAVGGGLVRRPAAVAVFTLSAGFTDHHSSPLSLCSYAAFDVLVTKKVLTNGSNGPLSICTISGAVSYTGERVWAFAFRWHVIGQLTAFKKQLVGTLPSTRWP